MRYSAQLLSLAVLCLTTACAASQPQSTCPDASAVEAGFAAGETQSVSRADELTWVTCPPSLPAGCEMSVLEGDLRKEMLFTVRVRIPNGFEMNPHWHPGNERATILEGRIGVGFGDEVDREKAIWFGPGDYYVNAKGAHHFVLADGPVLLQLTGLGPWKVNYLDAD